MPRPRNDEPQTGETHTTGGELAPSGWTKVEAPPPASSDVLRTTPDERAEAAVLREAESVATAVAATIAETPVTPPPPAKAPPPLEKPLPDWVPASGCLTIVGASDLARNLGVVDELDDAGVRP